MKSIRLPIGNRAGQCAGRKCAGAQSIFSTTTILPRICPVVKSLNCYNFVTFLLQIDYATANTVALLFQAGGLYTVYSIQYSKAGSWNRGALSWKLELEPPLEPRRRAGTLASWKLDTSWSLGKLAPTVGRPATSWKAGSWSPMPLCITRLRKLELRRRDFSELRSRNFKKNFFLKYLTFCEN